MTLQPARYTTPAALDTKTPNQHLEDIPIGSNAKATFELMAKRATRIVAVLTSCNCTTAAIDNSELTPGDRAFLNVEWTLAETTGYQSTAITIVYLDETQTDRVATLERLSLHLHAHAIAKVTEVPKASANTQQF